MIIGITGGTGCGKTTALSVISQLGGKVLDCDAIYHQLLETDNELLSAIETAFPGVVEAGKLNRKKLGSIVFGNEDALQTLNAITHTRITQVILKELEAQSSLVAIDAIALFESGLAALCDVTVAITAPEDVRIQRIMARDNISYDYAKSRIDAQPSQEIFSKRCDYTLCNDSTENSFQGKCLAFFKELAIMKLT